MTGAAPDKRRTDQWGMLRSKLAVVNEHGGDVEGALCPIHSKQQDLLSGGSLSWDDPREEEDRHAVPEVDRLERDVGALKRSGRPESRILRRSDISPPCCPCYFPY